MMKFGQKVKIANNPGEKNERFITFFFFFVFFWGGGEGGS